MPLMPLIATLLAAVLLSAAFEVARRRRLGTVRHVARTFRPLRERKELERLAALWNEHQSLSGCCISVKTTFAIFRRAGIILSVISSLDECCNQPWHTAPQSIDDIKITAVKARRAAILSMLEILWAGASDPKLYTCRLAWQYEHLKDQFYYVLSNSRPEVIQFLEPVL